MQELHLERPRAVRALEAVLLVVGLAYLGSLVLPVRPSGFNAFWDGWVNNGVWLLAGILALSRAVLVRRDRAGWALVGVALLCYLSGSLVYYLHLQHLKPIPYPSVADVLWVLFYLLMYVAVVLLLKGRIGRLPAGTWLDGLIGGLAAGSIGALLLSSVLTMTGGTLAVVVTNLAYPIVDLLLVVLLVAGAAVLGWRPGVAWWLLTGGLAAMVVTDANYLLEVADGSYVDGGPLDAGWAVSLLLLGLAPWRPHAASHAARGLKVLLMPLAASLTALGVLAYASADPVAPLARVLALLALLAAILRTGLSFREAQDLAVARAQARTDDLTGLPNRRAFLEDLDRHLLRSGEGGRPGAVLIVDLDRFKEVNDSFGHQTGDALLRAVGRRLRDALPAAARLSRMGGDEFAALLPETGEAAAVQVAADVVRAMRAPFDLDGLVLHVDASIGIGVEGRDGTRADGLLRHADLAMYRAKQDHLGHQLYEPSTDDVRRDRLQTLEELRTALDGDELVVHYQPQVALGDGGGPGRRRAPLSVEALVRWRHPVRGLLSPEAFLPLAEQAGLMRRLTLQVLQQALQDLKGWRDQGHDLAVSVNLSVSNLQDSGLPEQVQLLLDVTGVLSSHLTLEITEDVLMADPDRAQQVLAGLSALGVGLSVDDYGTGYSSLTYLRALPVDELKLDKTFVTHLRTEQRSAAIVRSTIELSHQLGLVMVAEGVEDAGTLDLLRAWGCDLAQGYHVSRPLAAPRVAAWLDERRQTPSRA